MESSAPHWLLVLLGCGFLSLPFWYINTHRFGAGNPNTTAPFTYYQGITSSLNLAVVGGYMWLADYATQGQWLLGAGAVFAALHALALRHFRRRTDLGPGCVAN